ncbi:hypothetical protein HNY73_004308 [Argiope bruennichi]|uniref:Uncharacterized protein n=1 Tax=Argiope bruennichi TaxID=94029 RepID=A0A8T0FQZ6_ARGBR|nr:hypothetical protein HNY73_004308 [Argiope bruennichi]
MRPGCTGARSPEPPHTAASTKTLERRAPIAAGLVQCAPTSASGPLLQTPLYPPLSGLPPCYPPTVFLTPLRPSTAALPFLGGARARRTVAYAALP